MPAVARVQDRPRTADNRTRIRIGKIHSQQSFARSAFLRHPGLTPVARVNDGAEEKPNCCPMILVRKINRVEPVVSLTRLTRPMGAAISGAENDPLLTYKCARARAAEVDPKEIDSGKGVTNPAILMHPGFTGIGGSKNVS